MTYKIRNHGPAGVLMGNYRPTMLSLSMRCDYLSKPLSQ
jgi:hypothetical protein